MNVPSCRRWHKLREDFVRPIPFDMTEEEARQADPPWDQWKQWDWWPPPVCSLEDRMQKAREMSSCRLFIEELVQYDTERATANEHHTNEREERTK